MSHIVSMPHAALWVVQQWTDHYVSAPGDVSMPHAALWVVQLFEMEMKAVKFVVSMPHAALWVVQHRQILEGVKPEEFQCRTRLCGWCSVHFRSASCTSLMFQCRTRLCGWCSS